MKTLEVTMTITLQVFDTGDKTYDCLVAVDAAKDLLNKKPGYELLRPYRSMYGDPSLKITKLTSASQGWVDSVGPKDLAPLSIDTPIE